jgi:hypothetical protein
MAIYNLQAKVMKTALLTMLMTAIAIPETYAAGRTAKSIANTVLSDPEWAGKITWYRW